MKRSRINTTIVDAIDYLLAREVVLPYFARWTPSEIIQSVGSGEGSGMVVAGLGWQVTDYGLDDFPVVGLVSFTMRRAGLTADCPQGACVERTLVLRDGQRTPHHRHRSTHVDVSCRAGGPLTVRLHHALDAGDLDPRTALEVKVDGKTRSLRPGTPLTVHPGQNVAIPPELYREYTVVADDVVVSELLTHHPSDDDTMFFDPVGVAMNIEEDEPPRYLLISDYAKQFPQLAGS